MTWGTELGPAQTKIQVTPIVDPYCPRSTDSYYNSTAKVTPSSLSALAWERPKMDADSIEDSPASGAWGNISQNNFPPTDEAGSWAVFAVLPIVF